MQTGQGVNHMGFAVGVLLPSWAHSHSGLQELMGHYAPLVIDSAGAERAPCDHEHVVVL